MRIIARVPENPAELGISSPQMVMTLDTTGGSPGKGKFRHQRYARPLALRLNRFGARHLCGIRIGSFTCGKTPGIPADASGTN
ncbi:hypothetical protein ZHAS_00022120 [Anopheles sinensis]|uniref:Uncharacterized protein n=1 Tax=Anopheles sinensis TaxID=74873 RepID=A0A084WU47_ANOSI|nr:hypothetical protein ZHAS_00022120 [Anopheles sinensis]